MRVDVRMLEAIVDRLEFLHVDISPMDFMECIKCACAKKNYLVESVSLLTKNPLLRALGYMTLIRNKQNNKSYYVKVKVLDRAFKVSLRSGISAAETIGLFEKGLDRNGIDALMCSLLEKASK
jgi:hypothetical protein